jgi:hypothetical protein
MVEIMRFRLRPEADAGGFEAADAEVQTQFAYRQLGIVRRTTARGTDGGWVVITLWRSSPDADASKVAEAGHPAVERFFSYVDATTVQTDRFATLD